MQKDDACAMRGREDKGGSYRWRKLSVGVCTELFWHTIYCANPRPNTGSKYSYWYLRGLVIGSPQIMPYYRLATEIAIHLSTQPCMCEGGSSSLVAMIRLKFARTTGSYFPSMPSTDRKTIEKWFRFPWQFLPCLSLFTLSHWDRSFFIGYFL